MVIDAKQIGALVLRLMVGLALLSCPRMGSAQGTWSVISLPSFPPKPGEVSAPTAMAVDSVGNLYVADRDALGGRIQKRDAQGNCYENRRHGPVQADRSPAVSPLPEATGR